MNQPNYRPAWDASITVVCEGSVLLLFLSEQLLAPSRCLYRLDIQTLCTFYSSTSTSKLLSARLVKYWYSTTTSPHPMTGCLPRTAIGRARELGEHVHVVKIIYLVDVPFRNKLLSVSKILIHSIQRWIGDGKEAEPERGVRRMNRAVTFISSPPWPPITYHLHWRSRF